MSGNPPAKKQRRQRASDADTPSAMASSSSSTNVPTATPPATQVWTWWDHTGEKLILIAASGSFDYLAGLGKYKRYAIMKDTNGVVKDNKIGKTTNSYSPYF